MDRIHATDDNMMGAFVYPVCGLALPVGGDDVLVYTATFRLMDAESEARLDAVRCRECKEITS